MMAPGRGFLAAILWLLAVPAAAGPPSVVAVQPARTDSLLVCRVRTHGLPGEEMLSTLHSGLASAVDLELEVLDAGGRSIAGRLLRLDLAFDLWEEVFTVTLDDRVIRLENTQALSDWLGKPPWLPVAPLAALHEKAALRLRVVMRLHTIAPSMREHLGSIVAGPDGQEVSIGLGRLIRYFYRGGRRDRATEHASSPPFSLAELRHAQD